MLGTNTYPAACVQAARDEIAAQIQAYRDLVGAASKASGMSLTRIDAALAAFEPAFFNNLLIALDARFAQRPSGAGDVLDEVRTIVAALLAHAGVMTGAADVGYDPSRSVLRLEPGDRIALNADDFEALCAAFLAEIEKKQAFFDRPAL